MSERSPKTDPKPGDVIQVHPRLIDEDPPSPLTVTDVDDRFVYWQRGDHQTKTDLYFWVSPRSPRMTLLNKQAAA